MQCWHKWPLKDRFTLFKLHLKTVLVSLYGRYKKDLYGPAEANMRLQQSEIAKLSEYLPKLVFFNKGLFTVLSTSHPLTSSPPGVLPGLTPSTRYIITVSACSPVGCTESLHNDNGDDNDMRSSLRTPEEGKAIRQKHTYLHIDAAVTPVFLYPSPIALIYDCFCIWTHTDTLLNTPRHVILSAQWWRLLVLKKREEERGEKKGKTSLYEINSSWDGGRRSKMAT